MNTADWLYSVQQARLEREAEQNPRCSVCDSDEDVAHDVDLGAPLCAADARRFHHWADAHPDAFYEDWPPLDQSVGDLIPAGMGVRTTPRVNTSARGLGVALVVSLIMALLVGGFITLLSGEIGSAPHLAGGFALLAAGMGLMARLVQTGALR